MQKIRAIRSSDFDQIKDIHEKFFAHEFSLPNFTDHFLLAYVVEDDGRIITAGGVRTILETVVITNKDYSVKDRRGALVKMLEASVFSASSYKYDQIHAFVQDKNWQRHLEKEGFHSTKGNALVLEI